MGFGVQIGNYTGQPKPKPYGSGSTTSSGITQGAPWETSGVPTTTPTPTSGGTGAPFSGEDFSRTVTPKPGGGGSRSNRSKSGGSEALASTVGEAGTGLLDPSSDYYQRLVEGMKSRIGKEAGGNYRAAALRAAQGGFGGGQSGELMDMQADIGRAGLEAQGEAGANLRLEAPKTGASMALGAGGLTLGGEQLEEGGRQFDVGTEEGARQFNQAQQQQAGQFGQSLGQRQTEFGGSQGNIAAANQLQADQFQASQQQQAAQFQQQMDFAMQQLYGS